MDANAVEVALNTQSKLDKYLQNKNIFVRLFYRTNRRRLTYFLVVYWIFLLIILFFVLSELEAMGFGDVYLGLLVAFVAVGYAAFATSMYSAFKRKEEKITKLSTTEDQQPMTDEEMEQFRRLLEEKRRLAAQLKSDEENKRLQRLLFKSREENRQLRRLLEEQKKLLARKADVSPDDFGVVVEFPVVKQGSGSQVAVHSKSIQIHSPPVGSPESSKSSETFGKGHDTAAISEKHDSSRSGTVSDSAVRSHDLERVSVIETGNENSEELPTKSDEPEQLETKESAGSSSLEEVKHAEKNDSQTCGGDDRQSSLEESDAVNDMPLRNDDESVNTTSSDSPPRKKVRTTSV